MNAITRKWKTAAGLFALLALFCSMVLAPGALAASASASLSCYVNAMGGIEFGEKLLRSADVTEKDGKYEVTLKFSDDDSLEIYTVNAHVFINADKAPVGYYDAAGKLHTTKTGDVTIKKSAASASDPEGKSVHYLESMTFTLAEIPDEMYLYLYVDSQVMGVQFCDGSGDATSGHPDETTPYKAILSLTAPNAAGTKNAESGKSAGGSTGGASKGADKTEEKTARVVYDNTVSGEYVVSIPAVINVDKETKEARYVVAAQKFDIGEGAYVTVSADASGTLKNGDASLPFTNTLDGGKLTKTGDKLAGKIAVTGTSKTEGRFEGAVRFTVNYFSGK